MTTEIKDSGARTQFATGAVRDISVGKGLPSLVPNWVVWLVSRIYEDGAKKYTSRNWEKGMNLSRYIDSLERHLAKLKAGMRDEPHASQVAWNILGYIYTSWQIKTGKRPNNLNDMPDQLSIDPTALAEPLSPYEYKSLENFFGECLNSSSKVTWQYLAGMLDGEGNISIVRRERKRREAYSLRVNLYSNTQEALVKIREEFGGYLRPRKRDNPKHATGYLLSWNHQAAGSILKNVAPFLLIKAQQARLGLEFQKMVSALKPGRRGLEISTLITLRKLKRQVNFLNRKGPR